MKRLIAVAVLLVASCAATDGKVGRQAGAREFCTIVCDGSKCNASCPGQIAVCACEPTINCRCEPS